MTLTIDLSPEMEQRLRERAAANGKDVKTFVREAIEEKLQGLPTFDEICVPLRQAVEASGLSDHDLDSLFQDAITEARKERRAKQD